LGKREKEKERGKKKTRKKKRQKKYVIANLNKGRYFFGRGHFEIQGCRYVFWIDGIMEEIATRCPNS